MKSNYKRLGEHIRVVDVGNKALQVRTFGFKYFQTVYSFCCQYHWNGYGELQNHSEKSICL